jgi:ribosomal protein L37AE/L43A
VTDEAVRDIRETSEDGVVTYRCPSCPPNSRKKLVVGIFDGWVEGYCRHCKQWHTFHEPHRPKDPTRPIADPLTD